MNVSKVELNGVIDNMERIRQRFIQGYLTLDEFDERLQDEMVEYISNRAVKKNSLEYKWVKLSCVECGGTGDIISVCYVCNGDGEIENLVTV